MNLRNQKDSPAEVDSNSAIGRVSNHALTRIPLWKRPLDYSLILLTIPLWLPILGIGAAWVAAVSKGGVFYRQTRIGYGGRVFTIFKFRTMIKGADTRVHEEYLRRLAKNGRPMTKLDGIDGRLIRGGKFLRASGLDELPQLLNVLRGEMSLVGPRPCLPAEFSAYKPFCLRRLNGLPGITGSWQVNGKNKTTFRRMMALDALYLRKISLGSDLAVLFRTIPAIAGDVLDVLKKRYETRQLRAEADTFAPLNPAPSPRTQATEIFRVAKTMIGGAGSNPMAAGSLSGHTERMTYRAPRS